jgi:hypothetical protein
LISAASLTKIINDNKVAGTTIDTTNIDAVVNATNTAVDTTNTAANTATENSLIEIDQELADAQVAADKLAADAKAAAEPTIDTLSLTDNTITIGGKSATVSSGTFTDVSYTAFSADAISNDKVASLYNLSFGITNPTTNGFENDETKQVALGIKVTSTIGHTLFMGIDNIQLTNNNGTFTISVPEASKLYGYAKKATDTTAILVEKTNVFAKGIVTTDATGNIAYDLTAAVKEFEGSLGGVALDLKKYFGIADTYTVDLVISGLSGVTNATSKTVPDNATLKTIFDATTVGFTGKVTITE